MGLTEKMMKSVLEQDPAPVVLCNLENRIVYMNPAAEKAYLAEGGAALKGADLGNCHSARSNRMIREILERFRSDRDCSCVYTARNEAENKDIYMVALRDGDGTLIGYTERHVFRNRETAPLYEMKE